MNNTTKRIFLAVACCGFLAILYSADRIPIVAGDPDGPMQTGDTAAFVGPIKADGYEQTTRQNLQVDPRTGLSIDDPYVDLDIDELTTTTLVAGDYLAFADTSDSGNPKKGLVSDITALATTALDGDKGDITVSSSGTVWTVDDGLSLASATITDLSVPNGIVTNGLQIDVLTGYLYGNAASPVTASTTIPNTAITGLGTMSTQNANSVAITGGSINGTTIGASTPSTGSFTTLATTGNAGIGGTASTRLHVVNGAGSLPSLFAETLFLVQRNDTTARNSFMTILSGTAGAVGISFGDTDQENRGLIQYTHSTDQFLFRVGGSGTDVTYDRSAGLVVNEGGNANVDIRAESDTNANFVFLDAGANAGAGALGVGGTPGAYTLDVSGTMQVDTSIGIGGAATGALSTQSNVVVFNETGDANGDFRVESDNVTSMLYVDAGADRVGVGTSSPVQELHVEGEIFVGSISPILIDIDNDDTADAGIYVGDASPEGAITAKPGSLFLNTSGGAGSTLYVKESGTGNTGWVAK